MNFSRTILLTNHSLLALTLMMFLGELDVVGANQLDGNHLHASFLNASLITCWQGGGPGGPEMTVRLLVEKFDKDKNGKLDDQERKLAREFAKSQPQSRRGPGGPGGRGGRGGPGGGRRPPGGPGGADKGPGGRGGPGSFFGFGAKTNKAGPKVAVADAETYPDKKLYDTKVLRTLFLEFKNEDWEAELADFYKTDVNVPATLTVDGMEMKEVGIRFRGNSSYFSLSAGQKRSLNLAINYGEKGRKLYGYKTLNLLNAHTDPSFMRTVLFGELAQKYVPTARANFVRVVINGESWGIYVNAQQFNKDFIDDWFGTRKGARWKMPAGGGGGRGMTYNGDTKKDYTQYQLKSDETDRTYKDLIDVCSALDTTDIEKLDTELDKVLDVDRALWFLAVDNALIDGDGYYARGADYVLFQDPEFHRFHVLPYDSNETFHSAPHIMPGMAGPASGGGGRQGGILSDLLSGLTKKSAPFQVDPLYGMENEYLPLISRLFRNPRLRMRYLAHVKTISDESLKWKDIEPKIKKWRKLIGEEITKDTRKLYTDRSYQRSVETSVSAGFSSSPGLKEFFIERRRFLMAHKEINLPTAEVTFLEPADESIAPNQPIAISATVEKAELAKQLILYYQTKLNGPFSTVKMTKVSTSNSSAAANSSAQFSASIPAQVAGTKVAYYVESRGEKATRFYPRRTGTEPKTLRVGLIKAAKSAVVINEVMASNLKTAKNSYGEFGDWIELLNQGDSAVDLSGMYLTDSKKDPRKWQFPKGTSIAPKGVLIVWADEKKPNDKELHASFKLSKSESLLLIDNDQRQNKILDSASWQKLDADQSWIRKADGVFTKGTASFGKPN